MLQLQVSDQRFAATAIRSAFLGIDQAVAACDDLVVSALGDRCVHLHLAVPLAWHHLGRPAGAFGDLGVIERRSDGITVDLAGFLDGGFPQLQAAIGAGRSAARREQEVARETPCHRPPGSSR